MNTDERPQIVDMITGQYRREREALLLEIPILRDEDIERIAQRVVELLEERDAAHPQGSQAVSIDPGPSKYTPPHIPRYPSFSKWGNDSTGPDYRPPSGA